MTAVHRSTAIGVYEDRGQAEHAVAELLHAHFPDESIGFIGRNLAHAAHAGSKHKRRHVEEGAAVGAIAGGAIGTIAGLAVVAGIIPGIGPVILGGMWAAVLASLAAGVAVGSTVGTLVGLGIPEEEAKQYEEELQAGRFLVTVQAGARYQDAIRILRKHGALGQGEPLI
jgi:hypothetical protein